MLKGSCAYRSVLGVALVSLLLGLSVEAFFDYGRDFRGPYCRKYGSCCDSRKDDCGVPIADTICYCDEFCDRGDRSDCCPDYESFCLGIQPPPENITMKCLHKGVFLSTFEKTKDNCNVCTCKTDGSTVCEQNVCLIDDSLINNVNSISRSIGWQATNYSEFWGHVYDEGLQLRLGTKEPTHRVKAMTKLSNKPESLPRAFNAFDQWKGMITPIRDQGWCGASWAISTASVASDRFGIQTKGKESVDLSSQHLLSCVRHQSGCNGGRLDWAWNYIRKIGLVDDDCYPYEGKPGHCRIRRHDTLTTANCHRPTKVPRDHMYRVGPSYSLNNESDIMIEIMESGPVQATMRVYRDLFVYKEGVYRHTAASRSEPGFHSVRLVGWGEERHGHEITKYWIAANSWGTWWGEDGFFRILRGSNECEIESYVLGTWPHAHLRPKKQKQPRRPFY